MSEIETKLRNVVKGLLADGKVEIVVGYEKGSLPLRSRPCFVRSADEADKLVWNSFCSNNVAVYLPRLFEKPARPPDNYAPPKVGVVAKGCDCRSIVGLIKEHQVPRENVVIIGMPCPGMADPGKADETLAEACLECSYPSPEVSDVQIEGEPRASFDGESETLKEFENKSDEERWQYFAEELSKCIRCNACRQACPNCYCKVCFVEQSKPRWVAPGDETSDVMLYHIGRIFHQAGRCVECGACVRACPMNIDLRSFTQRLGKDVKELFGYTPGLSIEDLPPLCTFEQDDNQDFLTEP